MKRITTFWKHPDFIYKLTKDFQEIKRLKQKITIMAQEAIDSKVECVIERLKQRRELNKEDDIEYLSMLELYIDTKKKNSDSLSRIELVDDFITLVGTVWCSFKCNDQNLLPHFILRRMTHNRQQSHSL